MTPEQLQCYLTRRGWNPRRFALTINTPVQTVRDWLKSARVPGAIPLVICELERRRAEKAGLGTMSCPACDGIAVEDAGLDDRYGCVLCGARVDPDASPARPRRRATEARP